MCGIVGINAISRNVCEEVLVALKNLEYRGYDSSGVCGLVNGSLKTLKVAGKIAALKKAFQEQPFSTQIMLGHTRWATHGSVTQINAHPHVNEQVAVVHNGIVENYLEIKNHLISEGCKFVSDTDSEIFPHLIGLLLKKNWDLLAIFEHILSICKGSFALVVIFKDFPDLMIALRNGSPLVIGLGLDVNVVASDIYAFADLTNKVYYLKDREIAFVRNNKIDIFNNGKLVDAQVVTVDNHIENQVKGEFQHFMLKEIYQQPIIIHNLIQKHFKNGQILFDFPEIDFKKINQIQLIACGSSFYAALLAKYWLEKLDNVFIDVDLASEYRYRKKKVQQGVLSIFLSQSGETADTLAALKHAKAQGHKTLSIVNVKESSIDRESDYSLYCEAGPEVSVASTKAFTSQLTLLALLTSFIANKKSETLVENLLASLIELPIKIENILKKADQVEQIANEIYQKNNILFIGRNIMFPIALEGALKLKEISYIHAEAIPAGELKHGPIALIDQEIPVILLAPANDLFEKILSNAQEIASRNGKIYSLCSKQGSESLESISQYTISIEKINDMVDPFLYVTILQLLAYKVALKRGTDVDQPRNLAKAVTVE